MLPDQPGMSTVFSKTCLQGSRQQRSAPCLSLSDQLPGCLLATHLLLTCKGVSEGPAAEGPRRCISVQEPHWQSGEMLTWPLCSTLNDYVCLLVSQ